MSSQTQIQDQRDRYLAIASKAGLDTEELNTLAMAEAAASNLPLLTASDWILAAELVTIFRTDDEQDALLAGDASLIDLAGALNPTIDETSPSSDPHFERFLHDTIRDMAHQSTKDGHWDCPRYNQ